MIDIDWLIDWLTDWLIDWSFQASDKEREKSLPTLKDNDFLGDNLKICIGEEAKEKLLETLAADAEFLAR